MIRAFSFALRASVALAVFVMTTGSLFAQNYNANLSGGVSDIAAVIQRAESHDCWSSRCLLGNKPLRLTLTPPMVGSVSMELTRASIPTHVIREYESRARHERLPILLKGTGRIRHYNRDGSTALVPIAASIYRDDVDPIVEISLPRAFRFSRGSGLGVYRSRLSTLAVSREKNTRGELPSSSAFSQEKCGLSTTASYSGAVHPWRIEPIVRSQSTYNVIYIGTDFDSAFSTRAGCSSTSACHNKILSIINQASVFYERQLGYSLEVSRQFGPTNFGRETESSFLLDTVAEANRANRGEFIHNGSNSSENQIDLFKSFTGRTMADKVIGIAYVGTLCQNSQSAFSNAITQYVSAAVNPVVAAHEIGHTLNALHVTSGIMKPGIGSSPPQSFSSESLLTISDYLSQHYSECRQGTSSGMNEAPTGGDPHAGKPTTMRLSARASGTRKITLSTQVSSLQLGCQIRIRGASSARGASSGKVVMSVLPTSSISSVSGSISFGTRSSSSGSQRVYLAAEYYCPNGSISEVSKTVSFNPNTIRGLRSKTSPTKWISLLRSILS
jgi:hypothetical protein